MDTVTGPNWVSVSVDETRDNTTAFSVDDPVESVHATAFPNDVSFFPERTNLSVSEMRVRRIKFSIFEEKKKKPY